MVAQIGLQLEDAETVRRTDAHLQQQLVPEGAGVITVVLGGADVRRKVGRLGGHERGVPELDAGRPEDQTQSHARREIPLRSHRKDEGVVRAESPNRLEKLLGLSRRRIQRARDGVVVVVARLRDPHAQAETE